MSDIYTLKEAASTATPIVCFEFRFPSGHVERFAGRDCAVEGHTYAKRVLDQQLHETSLGNDESIGAFARIGVVLSNTDGFLTQIENSHGFKGAELIARFVFLELGALSSTSSAFIVFRGIADSPSLIDENRLVVVAENRFTLFHAKLPATPLQRRCPWHFPYDPETRMEAVDGGASGRNSPFYRCGYSPDITGGKGNLNGTEPYTSCSGTRTDCSARGMLDSDSQGRSTRRFGGFTFLPTSILVRTHGSRAMQPAAVHGNHPRSNDVAPLVYGEGWLTPPLIHSFNDGNLTRMLLLLCDGPVEGIVRVVVNGAEIPAAVEGTDMSASGWHKRIAAGGREGRFLPKPDNDGHYAESDPHGSMTTLEVVIPNALQKGGAVPTVEVLLQGLHLLKLNSSGDVVGYAYSSNPAWVLLDVLLRSGWQLEELDLPSFSRAATHCDELVEVSTWDGGSRMQPRFSCNLVLQKRRSVAEILRGLREGSFLMLRGNHVGKLEAVVEGTFALQQPVLSPFSNALEPFHGGWPAYEFGDGTSGRGGILRQANGAPSFRLLSKAASECPNRIYAEFQDAWNDFQTDRISLFDSKEVRRRKQEVVWNSRAMGLSTYPQAARAVYAILKRSTEGNVHAEFETGLKGLGLRPGDLITITYPRYGLERAGFRILRILPAADLRSARIVAQKHSDSWYSDDVLDDLGGIDRYRRPGNMYGTPRSLAGSVIGSDGSTQFDISEFAEVATDGRYLVQLRCGYVVPPNRVDAAMPPPVAPLVPELIGGAGTLAPDTDYCYRFTSVGTDGTESEPSSALLARTPPAATGCSVRFEPLQAPPGAVHIRVYRGPSPERTFLIGAIPAGTASFLDDGLPYQAIVPPDTNFDHANFYWREEVHPLVNASSSSAASITWAPATWGENQFQGKRVWIASGKGKGQEQTILSNNANTLVVEGWVVQPDVTSSFAIAEPTWRLGCKSSASPASFEIPNRSGAGVQIAGFAANALDLESATDRSGITRWLIGGGSLSPVDTDVPSEPVFTLSTRGTGDLSLTGVGFPALDNTSTIQSGTLEIHFRDELLDLPDARLSAAVDATQTSLSFTEAVEAEAGALLQINHEIVRVESVGPENQLTVVRGVLGSPAAAHSAGAIPVRLQRRGLVFAIPLHFFGSPASGAFQQSFYLPHVRVAAAELSFTNSVGESPRGLQTFSSLAQFGLRTGYGGQYALYAEGYLAIEEDAAIPLLVDRDHSVQDVMGTLEAPATGGPVEIDITADSSVYCSLTFPQGSRFSNVVSGTFLPPLRAGVRLGIHVRSVQHSSGTVPGRDLSIRIRL